MSDKQRRPDEVHLVIETEERAERMEVDGFGVVDRDDSEDEWMETHDAPTEIDNDDAE